MEIKSLVEMVENLVRAYVKRAVEPDIEDLIKGRSPVRREIPSKIIIT
jgi:hypothetical protein